MYSYFSWKHFAIRQISNEISAKKRRKAVKKRDNCAMAPTEEELIKKRWMMFLFRFLGLSSANLLTSFSLLFYDTRPKNCEWCCKKKRFQGDLSKRQQKQWLREPATKKVKHHQNRARKKSVDDNVDVWSFAWWSRIFH